MLVVQMSWATAIALLAAVAAICIAVYASRATHDEFDVRRRALRVLMGTSSVPTALALATSNSLPVCVALVCWCVVAIHGFKYMFPTASGTK